VTLVLLEGDRGVIVIDTAGDSGQAGDELGRLEADAHLVMVVLTADRGSMHPRTNLDSQDHSPFSEPASFLGGMRVGVSRWKQRRARDGL
jgi:hypothetical protein